MSLVEKGDLDALERSLAQAHPPQDELNRALIVAACIQTLEVIRLLVGAGADVRFRDPRAGWGALYYAVEHENSEAIKGLVEMGADIDLRDDAGATSIHLAVDVVANSSEQIGREPSSRLVDLLLGLEAKPDVRDKGGKTARDWAVESEYKNLINAFY